MAIRSRNKISPNFNMSSMTDIVFLLLIFFMLTSTLVNPNALRLLLPKANVQVTEPQSITLSVTEDLQYAVNGQMVPFESLERRLLTEAAKFQEPSVILHMDRTLPVQEMVNVMEIANRHKFKMVLATSPR